MRVTIRQIDNSQAVVIPKRLLRQVGLDGATAAEMTIQGRAIMLRNPANPVRTGWAEAARKIAEEGDDELVMGDVSNEAAVADIAESASK